MKSQQQKSEAWKSKQIVVLLLLFKSKYGGVPPLFRTLILVHLKEVWFCCNIFFGSRCIHSFRSCHHLYKFKQRKPEKRKILVNTVGNKIRQSAFNFFHMYLFVILRAPQKHLEKNLAVEASCMQWKDRKKNRKLENQSCAVTYFLEVGASIETNLGKEIQEDLRVSFLHLKQKRWSALNFFYMLIPSFKSSLKGLQHITVEASHLW